MPGQRIVRREREVTTRADGFTFEEVLRAERELLRGPAGPAAPMDPAAPTGPTGPTGEGAPGSAPGGLHQQDEFLGLAFSGGGIRSATFNLGVLQALSELKLLKEFDYLSTVSGGGYIGSWLSAWIHRAGIDAVEQQLSMKDHPHEEPREITFLRSYSNYLTPRTGIFSTDTLAAAGHLPAQPHPQPLDRPALSHRRPAPAAAVRVGRQAPLRTGRTTCSRAARWGWQSPCSSST